MDIIRWPIGTEWVKLEHINADVEASATSKLHSDMDTILWPVGTEGVWPERDSTRLKKLHSARPLIKVNNDTGIDRNRLNSANSA